MAFHGRRRAVFWLLLPLALFLASNIVEFVSICSGYLHLLQVFPGELRSPEFWRFFLLSVGSPYVVCDLVSGVAGLGLGGYLLLLELPRLYFRRERAIAGGP
jgi:hypothetical protein